jgi:hypothetical protein
MEIPQPLWMARITAIELGAGTCALARTAVRRGEVRVFAAEALDPAAFPGDQSFTAAVRQARKTMKLPRRARVVLWGLPEGSNRKDAAVKPLLAPLTNAGFRVERVVTPCNALAALARVRAPRGEGATCWLAVNRGGVAIIVVRPGKQIYAHSFVWDSNVGSSGSQARLLQRYSQVSFLSPEIRRGMAEAAKLGTPVSTVITCGNLPDLRSLTMPLIEELDVEVETLDSLDGLVVAPPASDKLTESASSIRLVCAGAIARGTRPWNESRRRAVHRSAALIRAAALIAIIAGAGYAWYRFRDSGFQLPAAGSRPAASGSQPPAPGSQVPASTSQRPASSGPATRAPAPVVAQTTPKPATPTPAITQAQSKPVTPAPVTQTPAKPATTVAAVTQAPSKPVTPPPATRTPPKPSTPAPAVTQSQPKPVTPPPVTQAPSKPASTPPPQASTQPLAKPAAPAPVVPPPLRAANDPRPTIPVTEPPVRIPTAPPPQAPAVAQRTAPATEPPAQTATPAVNPASVRADKPGAGTGPAVSAPTGPMPALLKDGIPRVTAILVANDRRFATIDAGRIVGVGDVLGRRIVVAVEEKAVVLREPSGVLVRVGLGGRVLGVERGR